MRRLYIVTVGGRAQAFGNSSDALRYATQMQEAGAHVAARRKRKPRWAFYHGRRAGR